MAALRTTPKSQARYHGLALGRRMRYRNFVYRLERRFGLADGVADSLDDVLGLVGFAGAKVVSIERSRSESIATWLSSVYYVLIGIGVLALMAEFKAPGFGFAGVVAIVCFASTASRSMWEETAIFAGSTKSTGPSWRWSAEASGCH